MSESSGPNWWDLLKQIFGISRGDVSGSGQNLLQPAVHPDDLNQAYTYTGSYESSPLKDAFNNAQFYYINDSGEVELVQDTNRIRIVKRAYNDGSVGLVFEDMATNQICMPRGVQFNSNVVENSRRPGEYLLRNGGSVNGTDPSNIMWNSSNTDYVANIVANSVVSAPRRTNPPFTPAQPVTKQYSTTELGKLAFRFMQGNSSVLYHGDILVKQIQLVDGGYVLLFSKPDGTELMPSTLEGSVDIQSFYRLETVNGVQRRVLYISPGGNSAFEWLESNYAGSIPPQPPSIHPRIVHYATNSIKFLLIDANGQVYTGSNFNVRYYYDPNNGQYQITFQDLQGNSLTLRGDNLPPLSNGRYQMRWERGKDFNTQFQEEFGGTPPHVPPPQPPLPTGYRLLQGNSNSAWKYLRIVDRDGNLYSGTYYIQYQQRKFRNEYSLQVNNLTCYRIDENGSKIYLNIDFGNVNFQEDSSQPVYDRNGAEIGEKYSMTLPNATAGSGSMQDFLTQYYSNNNEYPDPPPTPPPVNEYDTNTQSYRITFTTVDGQRYTGAIKISYQFIAGQWQFSVETADGEDTLILEGDGVIIAGRHDGNPIYGLEYEDGVSFQDSFDQAYEGTPPPPGPRPPDNTPRVISSINLSLSRYKGLIFTDRDGNRYTGIVGLYNLFQTDDEGKPLFQFHDADGNELKISVETGYHADELPDLDEPQESPVDGRKLQEGDDDPDDFTYEGDVGESIDEEIREFQDGYGITNKNPNPIPILDSEIKIEGIILYKEDEEVFGLNKFQVDEFNATNPQILGFCMYDPDYQKKEEINKYFDQSILTLDTEEKDEAPPMMMSGGGGGASESKEPPILSGTATSSGGEEAPHRHDLFSAPPAEYCQTGGGRGRRLQACTPNETPDPPSHERSEHREKVHEKLGISPPSGGVSQMDLLNFEYNRAHEDDPKHGFFSGEGDPEHTVEYDAVKETTDERELVSMYATFSDASYVDDTKRPESLFGMNYIPSESSNNFAVYTTPGGNRAREVVISIRGTKPSNVTDLMSDALILTGYQDQLSVRFNEDLIKVKALLDRYPDAQITLSSHSLGGAINDYIINELKGTKYESRVKAVSFNPGKAPNTKSERSGQIKELITDVSIAKALKEGDPRYLPIMSSIQRTLNINASDLAGGNLGTLSESQLQQYPELARSYQEMLGSLRGADTLAERSTIAEGWITRNRAFLEGGINIPGSITNLIKTKIYLDLAIAMFDWSANYSYDQMYKRESDLDARMKNTRNPYTQMFKDGNNAIFKYNSDPISVHHSLIDNDARNVRTYFQEDKRPSLLEEGLIGQLSYGLKSHGIDNFMTDSDKSRVDHSETTFESFKNILDDNVESLSGVLNGLARKGRKELEEFLEGIF